MIKIISVLIFAAAIVSANAQSLVLATYQYAENNRKANIQPLADHIARQTGSKVEVKSYPSVHLFIQGIQNNEVDIALINTFGYLLLEASSKKFSMKPYVVLQLNEGAEDNYKTAMIASSRLAIDTLSKLKSVASKSRLILVNPGSTSGNLVPRLALSSVGLENAESDFASLSYGKNHKATLDSVASGRADIGAVGSSEYFNFAKDPTSHKKIKLLWMSPEIPLGPVLLHDRISPELRDTLLALFTALKQADSHALEAVKSGWSEAKQADKYVRIEAGYYLPFQKQLGDRKTMARILEQFAN